MQSVAIFPCSYTHGASVIGELSNCLRLKVYTDELLFADVSKQFGLPVEELRMMIFEPMPPLNRYLLKKERYVNLLKCSLDAQSIHFPGRRLYFGMHTSLLDMKKDRVLKILVFDNEEHRVKRAMQQDGLNEKAAREHVRRHDEKVSSWTRFLFDKEPYDHSLYDVVISLNNRNSLEITAEIVELFQDAQGWQTLPAAADASQPMPNKVLYLESQTGWMA